MFMGDNEDIDCILSRLGKMFGNFPHLCRRVFGGDRDPAIDQDLKIWSIFPVQAHKDTVAKAVSVHADRSATAYRWGATAALDCSHAPLRALGLCFSRCATIASRIFLTSYHGL